MRDGFNQLVNVRISNEQLAVLERRAQELGGNISTAVRAIITEWARDHNNGKQPQLESHTETSK